MPQCQIMVCSLHTEQITERALLVKHRRAHTLGFMRRRRLGMMYSNQRHVGTTKLKLAGRRGREGEGLVSRQEAEAGNAAPSSVLLCRS